MMHHHNFEKSTVLSSCSYDSDTQELTVIFTSGKSYTYKDVAINTYNDLIGARSAGQHFASIKNGLKLK